MRSRKRRPPEIHDSRGFLWTRRAQARPDTNHMYIAHWFMLAHANCSAQIWHRFLFECSSEVIWFEVSKRIQASGPCRASGHSSGKLWFYTLLSASKKPGYSTVHRSGNTCTCMCFAPRRPPPCASRSQFSQLDLLLCTHARATSMLEGSTDVWVGGWVHFMRVRVDE